MNSNYFGRILELLLRDVISKPPVCLYVPRFNHGSCCVRIVCVQEDKTVWHQQTTTGLHMRIATVCFFRSVCMSAFVRADFCKISYSEYLLKSVNTSGFL
jgi:hypothetical protein